ncbi:hypothetical protein CAPTEDRAFT_201612 [Capitella teleta]|uniref:Uncharacterized protein n=1 Tax=Capitella teleta TaxID=283909 RepID=R7V871_CAPTE|nr:hypothetical protein CAPTEDRAFT_201612 [Capitella teleta]|eukprot:ELU12566.1 hypothetical protein CAPTEDRAFT_201612 [Capitella teleta]
MYTQLCSLVDDGATNRRQGSGGSVPKTKTEDNRLQQQMMGGLIAGFTFCVIFSLGICFCWKAFARLCGDSARNKIGPMDLRAGKGGAGDDVREDGGYQENTTMTQSQSNFTGLDSKPDATARVPRTVDEGSDSEAEYPMPRQNGKGNRQLNARPFKPLEGTEARTRASSYYAPSNGGGTMDFR